MTEKLLPAARIIKSAQIKHYPGGFPLFKALFTGDNNPDALSASLCHKS
jgi:hypothetical protein